MRNDIEKEVKPNLKWDNKPGIKEKFKEVGIPQYTTTWKATQTLVITTPKILASRML